jgi:hypothetical protein
VSLIIESGIFEFPLGLLGLDEEHMRCHSQDARKQGKPMARGDERIQEPDDD